VLPGARVVAHGHDLMRPQIPQGVPCQVVQSKIGVARMVRYGSIVPHVPTQAHRRRDDDVFTRHVSESGHDGAWDVHIPHGPESLQLYSLWTDMNRAADESGPMDLPPI